MLPKYRYKTKPYKHQQEALEKCWDKEDYALFMEMGTGKSKVLIDNIAILYDIGRINKALTNCPNTFLNIYYIEQLFGTLRLLKKNRKN